MVDDTIKAADKVREIRRLLMLGVMLYLAFK